MAYFDVFNGDADGLCALHQLRLAEPRVATLVTGTKRDIALLQRVQAHAGDIVTVLDVSMQENRTALIELLKRDVSVQYFDHHDSGEVPVHPHLETFIDTRPDICTGILVDRWLNGKHRLWAIVAAYGDNFALRAATLAGTLALTAEDLHALQELGECLNYNAYGDSESDLLIHPAELYDLLRPYTNPFAFMASERIFGKLRMERRNDLDLAMSIKPYASLVSGKIMLLPDEAWSRRIRGAYGNLIAVQEPHFAHAVLTPNAHGGYTVSIRAPLSDMRGADKFCHLFSHGGGRPAAGGIDNLPATQLHDFITAFEQAFPPKA